MKPSIAAVILNYNYADYVRDAIESVEQQTVPFDEIVVVNDGSTDNSMEVLSEYGDHVRVLDIPNGGQFGACIAGLRAVKSDYVYFLDADDCALPELAENMKRAATSEPVKIQFQLEGVTAERQPLQSWFPTFPDNYDSAKMRSDNETMGFYTCPPTSGNVYRRETLLNLPLDKMDPRDFIDGPATLVLPHLGEVISLMQPLALYRVHGKNHSQRDAVTSDVLQGETDWFYRRWSEACMILNSDVPPFRNTRPLYVVERQLMMKALDGGNTFHLTREYLRVLRSTQTPSRHKFFFHVWAVLLVLPLQGWRSRLVASRRSSANRSALMRRAMSLFRRYTPN